MQEPGLPSHKDNALRESSTENSSLSVTQQLSNLINQHLAKKPHLSLLAISKKCRVSEPTLRRIRHGKIKKSPSLSTVLNLMTYLAKTSDVQVIIRDYPGPIADFIRDTMPQVTESNSRFDQDLNEELKNPLKYIAFKLAANRNGLNIPDAQEILGDAGITALQELTKKGFLDFREGTFFSLSDRPFSIDPEQFIEKFKTVADYISVDFDPKQGLLNAMQANYSQSISPAAYKKVIELQRKTVRRIREICNSPEASGELPFFFLCAVDVLAKDTPYDYRRKSSL